MTTTLSPLPVLSFRDNNGNPLANGQLFTYQAGTQTPAPTYTDSTGGFQNPNPVILNARGECQVWIPPNTAYKYVLTDPLGNTIWTVDQIINAQLLTLYGGVDTGIAGAYVLNFAAPFTSYTDGTVIYWVAANTNNAGPSTVNVNGLGVVAIVNPDTTALLTNQIIGGTFQTMIFKGGSFTLINGSYIPGLFTVLGSASVFGAFFNAKGAVQLGSGSANGVQGWGPTAAALVDMTPDKGTFTGTLNGMTGTVTGTFNFIKMGNFVCIYVTTPITGTSNNANMALSGMPAEILPAQTNVGAICAGSVIDNNISCSAVSLVQNNGFFQLGKNTVSGANVVSAINNFTASGTKGVSLGFAILYSLV
jgi:hypothetical protein